MRNKIDRGEEGEHLAANFLIAKGFEVVVRNYRYKKAEIDLIVRKDDWLLFVEVKTRSSSMFGEPEEFVDYKKSTKIFEAAEAFIYANDWNGHVRFDVIAVKMGWKTEIVHFEDAIN